MNKGFLTNKYTLSVFILLAILATDIYLHKGMSRVILPDGFTKKRSPQQDFPKCSQVLQIKGKKWMKAVNTVALSKLVDSSTNGIELDVYFDTTRNEFFVYHDTAVINTVTIDDIFSSLHARQVTPPVWLDFKNLTAYNKEKSLQFLLSFRRRFQLANKIIVESPHPELLQSFCDSNFYTSYYVPFFNHTHLLMNTDIKPGDRVEVTRTKRGGFFNGRYLATVIQLSPQARVRVRDDEGQDSSPRRTQVKKLN
ncbi:MAG: hypothetical protein EOO88_46435 [Pedobacter sp.]|nr:MAG: hypothetical protein EOO88_46435 [Pedobacter sp.]